MTGSERDGLLHDLTEARLTARQLELMVQKPTTPAEPRASLRVFVGWLLEAAGDWALIGSWARGRRSNSLLEFI